MHILYFQSRSPIVDFEETPQHIYTVQPGSEASVIPALAPPPYEVAGGENFKPPTYDQAISQTDINLPPVPVCENRPSQAPVMEMESTVQGNHGNITDICDEASTVRGNPQHLV